ncbi:hypothetical protein [Zhihengliuella sp. ISTPL4]|uniref:hypothetical protein n=1 Tax=Zhihengliuella sp. ISTPL4 TaxID=2058657 RepID=UPI0013051AF1|nr:hypothetical protein [Zhihengliuella sp. ISTPL4]
MKRIRVGLATAGMAAVLLTGCTGTEPAADGSGSVRWDEVVLTVDGIDVDAAGLRHCALQERAAVYGDVVRDYGIGDGPGFWEHETGVTTPGSLLLERARARCVADTVRRERAVRLGIIDDATFSALTRRLAEENADRERRHEAGDVLYGPVEYTLVDFENKEFADAATAEETEMAAAITTDLARVDAFIAMQPDLRKETDVARARAIAVQMMAREMVGREIADAIATAEVVPHWDWFAKVVVADLLAETTESSR